MENKILPEKLQSAIFERLQEGTTFQTLASLYDISLTIQYRYYNQWTHNDPDRQPQYSGDILIQRNSAGRTQYLTERQENILKMRHCTILIT